MFRSWRQNFSLTFSQQGKLSRRRINFNGIILSCYKGDRIAQFLPWIVLRCLHNFFLVHFLAETIDFSYCDRVLISRLSLRFFTRLLMKLQSLSLVFIERTFSKLNFNFSQFFTSRKKFASHSWKIGKKMRWRATRKILQGFILLVL